MSKKRTADQCTPSESEDVKVVFETGSMVVPRHELSAALLTMVDKKSAAGEGAKISTDTVTEAIRMVNRLNIDSKSNQKKRTEEEDDVETDETRVVMTGAYPNMSFLRVLQKDLDAGRVTMDKERRHPVEDFKLYLFDGAEFYNELIKGASAQNPAETSALNDLGDALREYALITTADILEMLKTFNNVVYIHHSMFRNDPKTSARDLHSMLPHSMTCSTHRLSRIQMHDEISKLREKVVPDPKNVVVVAEDAMNSLYNHATNLVDDVKKRLAGGNSNVFGNINAAMASFKKYVSAVHEDADDYFLVCEAISIGMGRMGAFPPDEKDTFNLKIPATAERYASVAGTIRGALWNEEFMGMTRAELVRRITDLDSKNADCEAASRRLKDAASRLTDQNQAFEGKLRKSEKRIAALEQELKESRALAKERAKDVERLTSDAMARAGAKTSNTAPPAKSEAKSKSKSQEAEDLKDALKAARNAREASVEENRRLKETLDRMQKHLSDLATRHAALNAENEYRKAVADAANAASLRPEETYQKAAVATECEAPSTKNRNECPICLGENPKVMLDDCCHTYCESCMDIQWTGTTCPACAQWLTDAYLTEEPYTTWKFDVEERRWSVV